MKLHTYKENTALNTNTHAHSPVDTEYFSWLICYERQKTTSTSRGLRKLNLAGDGVSVAGAFHPGFTTLGKTAVGAFLIGSPALNTHF